MTILLARSMQLVNHHRLLSNLDHSFPPRCVWIAIACCRARSISLRSIDRHIHSYALSIFVTQLSIVKTFLRVVMLIFNLCSYNLKLARRSPSNCFREHRSVVTWSCDVHAESEDTDLHLPSTGSLLHHLILFLDSSSQLKPGPNRRGKKIEKARPVACIPRDNSHVILQRLKSKSYR